MKNSDEYLKFNNTGERRRKIKDKNILKKAEKLLYIERRVVKVPIINEKDKKDELILINQFTTK